MCPIKNMVIYFALKTSTSKKPIPFFFALPIFSYTLIRRTHFYHSYHPFLPGFLLSRPSHPISKHFLPLSLWFVIFFFFFLALYNMLNWICIYVCVYINTLALYHARYIFFIFSSCIYVFFFFSSLKFFIPLVFNPREKCNISCGGDISSESPDITKTHFFFLSFGSNRRWKFYDFLYRSFML